MDRGNETFTHASAGVFLTALKQGVKQELESKAADLSCNVLLECTQQCFCQKVQLESQAILINQWSKLVWHCSRTASRLKVGGWEGVTILHFAGYAEISGMECAAIGSEPFSDISKRLACFGRAREKVEENSSALKKIKLSFRTQFKVNCF